MQEKEQSDFMKLVVENRFVFLLIAMLMFIIFLPFIDEFVKNLVFVNLFLTAIFITAFYSIVGKKKHLVIAIILVVPLVLSVWFQYALKSDTIRVVGNIFGVLFFAFAIFSLLDFIFGAKDVNKQIIFAAIAVYLLLAMMWSYLYRILEYFYPGSFAIPEARRDLDQFVALYYSFVTITTLGYGDIIPLTNKASSLSILEAIIGQIYLVVLVAFLVGMHVARKAK
jgi:hypothetical protein